MKRDFTASLVIIREEGVLLLHHRKLQTWMPPGGHVEPNELPHEAALREAKEETGLDVQLYHQENMWVKEPNAYSIPRPFLCLLEEIPVYKETPAHQHIDFVFLGTPIEGSQVGTDEGHDLRWFTFDEVAALPKGAIFEEVRQLITKVRELSTKESLSPPR